MDLLGSRIRIRREQRLIQENSLAALRVLACDRIGWSGARSLCIKHVGPFPVLCGLNRLQTVDSILPRLDHAEAYRMRRAGLSFQVRLQQLR